jgi:hypothetical protein
VAALIKKAASAAFLWAMAAGYSAWLFIGG